MNVKWIVVPDVHERIVKLQKTLEHYALLYPNATVVFQGDFFDSFAGFTEYTHLMVDWLRQNYDNPKYIFLWGNHDLHYAYPINGLMCSGFDERKLKLIKSKFPTKLWDVFRLTHWIGVPADPDTKGNVHSKEYLVSHAGIHPYLLNPVLGCDKRWLAQSCEETMYKIKYEQTITPFVAIGRGRDRYATARIGGVVWLDWYREFMPIEGLNQIVGHTPPPHDAPEEVRIKEAKHSINFNLDTHLKHVLLVMEDGTTKVELI